MLVVQFQDCLLFIITKPVVPRNQGGAKWTRKMAKIGKNEAMKIVAVEGSCGAMHVSEYIVKREDLSDF